MFSTELASPSFISWVLTSVLMSFFLIVALTWIWSRRHSHLPVE